MEETKKKKVEKKEDVQDKPQKLTYEQLETVARQLSSQLDAVVKENNQLKMAIQQESLNNAYTELNFKFKVLERADMFSLEFVDNIVKNIEEIMTPVEQKEDNGQQED